MGNDLKWLIASDFHIPYHDRRLTDMWFKILKWVKPDAVDYAGDIDDMCAASRWSEGKTEEVLNSFGTYSTEVREFYAQTRSLLPDAQLYAELGNHDIRAFKYIDSKAPALREMITANTLWGLDDLGYEYIGYDDPPVKRFGDIYVHHGISISKYSGESVRNDVDSLGISLVRGHSHRAGSYYKTYNMTGVELEGYEIGCMVDMNSEGMSYTIQKNWQHAFAIAHIENGVTPHIQIVRIKDNVCYVDGRKFVA